MSLATYKKKRDFDKTPEPAGRQHAGQHKALHYVIQKHAASHLHYDFRLELDGVLKSWAVPKGPSLDPARKALAVQVEDHPLEYETFEGIIPAGQYGGGTVMLWDRGTWEPLEDPRHGLQRGRLRFTLHGEKLKGDWSLVRMPGKPGETRANWLLIKSRDQYAGSQDVLADATSVATRRTMEEIAANRDAVWDSHHGLQTPDAKPATQSRGKLKPAKGRASRSRMPREISPQLATLVQHPPVGEDWVHEIKFDGYRLLAFLDKGRVRLHTRTSQDWTSRFPALVPALEKIKADSAILDGEVVVLNDAGRSEFELLQTSFKAVGPANLHYYLFDILYLDGQDLRTRPLLERKAILKDLLDSSGPPHALEYSDHVQGNGEEVIRKACALGSEGIISKRSDAPYVSRRDPSWLKSKCVKGQEFIIIGYTRSTKRPDGLRSLLLGYHDAEHGLIYCGRVGTGFDTDVRRGLLEKLQPLARDSSPTEVPPPRREQLSARWVEPKLVCEAHFEGWTRDGVLRHPVFIALRLDKPPTQITREEPMDATLRHKPHLATAAAHPKSDTSRTGSNGHHDNGHKTNGRAPSAARKTPKRNGKATKSAPTGPQWAGVTLTHPEKLLYPADNLQKQDVANFYQIAAPFMLPHVADRPLALKRCPDGMAKDCFFMRNWSPSLPPAVGKVKVDLGKQESHVTIHDAAGLFSLVQISALEIHAWNCCVDDMEHPDQLVFDLDPGPDVSWKQVVSAAKTLREMLERLGLTPFLKTSGGKGLHLTVPIVPNVPWDQAKAFCKTIAEYSSQEDAIFIANMRKDLRAKRIYLDFLRNDKGSTAVAPYSTRARPGGAVSMPLEWKEVDDLKSADAFTLNNAGQYLESRKRDPWKDFSKARADLMKIVRQTAVQNGKE